MSEESFSAEIKLEDVFFGLFNALLGESSDYQIGGIIGADVAQRANNYAPASDRDYRLDNQSLQLLRIQLEALGLIEVIGKTSLGYTTVYWHVSEKGKRFAFSRLAMRKLNSVSKNS